MLKEDQTPLNVASDQSLHCLLLNLIFLDTGSKLDKYGISCPNTDMSKTTEFGQTVQILIRHHIYASILFAQAQTL